MSRQRYGEAVISGLDSRRSPRIEVAAVVELGGADRYIEIEMQDVGVSAMELTADNRVHALAMTECAKLRLTADQAQRLYAELGEALIAASRIRAGWVQALVPPAAVRVIWGTVDAFGRGESAA